MVYVVFVWTPSPQPPPPHAKACVSRNCDTNAHIQFIFDTAIDDLEWKNPIDFSKNRKTKMETDCALHDLNLKYTDVAIDLL